MAGSPDRKDSRTNLKIPADAMPHLEMLAQQFGKERAGEPSVNALVTAIGRRELDVIASTPIPDEYALVAPYVESRQAFLLAYPDKTTGELKTYPIHFAQLVYRPRGEVRATGGHYYLECYCGEANPKAEVAELAHNRVFRADKLRGEASALPQQSWRTEGLATVDVTLRLYGGLAHNYEPNIQGDEGGIFDLGEKVWIDATTCEVQWRISSFLWFQRAVFRYGDGCEVMSPPSVRQSILREIWVMARRYGEGRPD